MEWFLLSVVCAAVLVLTAPRAARWLFPTWYYGILRRRWEASGRPSASYFVAGVQMGWSEERESLVPTGLIVGLVRTPWATQEDVLAARAVFTGQLRGNPMYRGCEIRWKSVAEDLA